VGGCQRRIPRRLATITPGGPTKLTPCAGGGELRRGVGRAGWEEDWRPGELALRALVAVLVGAPVRWGGRTALGVLVVPTAGHGDGWQTKETKRAWDWRGQVVSPGRGSAVIWGLGSGQEDFLRQMLNLIPDEHGHG
jgi:hypothetical protein